MQCELELLFVKNAHGFVDEYLKKPEFVDLMRRLGALGDGNQDQSKFVVLVLLFPLSLFLLIFLVVMLRLLCWIFLLPYFNLYMVCESCHPYFGYFQKQNETVFESKNSKMHSILSHLFFEWK